MPLTLKPDCECCDRNLPNSDPAARICSFECTFCADCAQHSLGNTCPNCGGNLVLRPTRPDAFLARFPPSAGRVHSERAACREAR